MFIGRQQHLQHRMTLIWLTLFALVIRLIVICFWQFDGLYGQDSFAYLQQGIALAERLPQGRWPPLSFFWPNGYPLLIAFWRLIFGQTALAAQIATLVCGVLLAPLIYLLTKALFPGYGHSAGILAGLIIAIAGQPVLSSIVIMADIPALFWATLAAWFTVQATKKPVTARWFLSGAGLAAGLAVISRWAYALLIPALIGTVLYQIQQKRLAWWSPIFAVISGLVILLPQLFLSLNRPDGLFHSWLLGWRPLNFFLRHFEHLDGTYHYLLPIGLFYAQPAGHPAFIFPLLGWAALFGVRVLWKTQNLETAILLLGWLVITYLFFAGIPYQNLRFGLTFYPPLVILTSVGIIEIWQQAVHQSVLYRRVVLGSVIISFIGMAVWSCFLLDRFLKTQNQSKVIVQSVENVLPPEATLLSFGLTLTFQHYTDLTTLEFFYCDEAALHYLVQAVDKLYLLLDVDNIETQWQNAIPQRNYHWLRANTVLVEESSFLPYTLFRVDSTLTSAKHSDKALRFCLPPDSQNSR